MSLFNPDQECSFAKKKMLRRIAPKVYQISLMPRNSINCYIIENILVDSGIRSSYNTIKKALQKIPVTCTNPRTCRSPGL